MRRLLAVLICVILASAVLRAQQTALVVEHGVYGMHLLQRSIGTEEYAISESGTHRHLSVTSNTTDRGMKRTNSATLDYLLNLTPTRFEQHSISPATPTATAADSVSLTEIMGNKVTVHEGEVSRSFIKPAVAFTGFASMPAAVQMMMMRYWLHHHRPQRLTLLRASTNALPIEIRPVGHEVFAVHGRIVRLTRYTVQNLIFGHEVLWMNDSERIAAIMTFAGGLPQEEILDEYKSSFGLLFQSRVRQEMLRVGSDRRCSNSRR